MTLMTCKLPCYQRSVEISLIPVQLEGEKPARLGIASHDFPKYDNQHQRFFLLLQAHLRLIGAFYQQLTLGDRIERSRTALAIS